MGNGRILSGAAAVVVAALAFAAPPGAGSAAAHTAGDSPATAGITASESSAFAFTPTIGPAGTGISGDNQGFSVESADLAHGFLTTALLGHWLRNLGPHGVIRVGGYSVDLIWPAFGADSTTPAPVQALGGTVDQSDLDSLKQLLDVTGWKATIAVPLVSVLNTTNDSSLMVGFNQAVAYAVAAVKTLGSHLQAIEIGNEYNAVTSLTPAQYYTWLKQYYTAINGAIGTAHIKVVGPSVTGPGATQLDGFAAAAAADTTSDPRNMISAVTAHYYESGRCGLSVPDLMTANTYLSRQNVLENYLGSVAGLHDGMPVVVNETNSESGSGCPDVSDAYAASLWSLDYLLQAAQLGIQSMYFHTSTAAVCGNYQTSPAGYTISYRWYAAVCAPSQAALDANQLSATPLYYGVWAFRQVPAGRFVDLGSLSADGLGQIRAYGVESPDQTLTVVLINVQDPSSAASTDDSVTMHLPASYDGTGHAVTLLSSDPGGLGSTDASAISLGGRTISGTGVASGTPRQTQVPVTGGSAAIDVAPGTAQIVRFPGVQLPGAVDVTGVSASQPLLGGQATSVTVSVANTTSSPRAVTATVQVPSGWQAGSVTQTVPASGQADLAVPVTPPLAPTQATLTGQVTAPGVLSGGGPGLNVITTLPAADVALALDAGCTTSPVFDGYQPLTPEDTYSAATGYGWIGAVPQCRDRGQPDALREDLIASTSPATLQLAVPPGQHTVYVLTGDPSYAANPITISGSGGVLAQTTTPLPPGQSQWLGFTVDGGSGGQTVDLTFSGQPGEYWVVDALVIMP